MSNYSEEHKLFLKQKRNKKRNIIIVQFSIIIIFLITWQLLVNYNLINAFIFSSPKNVIQTFINLLNANNLWNHILITSYETIISFLLATILGLLIATIMWYNDFLAKVLDPYLTILNSLPKVALGPLIIIWLGAKIDSIIVMALMISLIVTIITIYSGFISTPSEYVTLLKSFKVSKTKLFTNCILPANKGIIIQSMKVNISMSLIGVIMGELLVSKEGIGYLIMYGSQVFNLDLVILGVALLGIISFIMYYLIIIITRLLQNKEQ